MSCHRSIDRAHKFVSWEFKIFKTKYFGPVDPEKQISTWIGETSALEEILTNGKQNKESRKQI